MDSILASWRSDFAQGLVPPRHAGGQWAAWMDSALSAHCRRGVRWGRLSIDGLIWIATVDLVEAGMSPAEVSQRLIQTPMSLLGRQGSSGMPDRTFDHMPAHL